MSKIRNIILNIEYSLKCFMLKFLFFKSKKIPADDIKLKDIKNILVIRRHDPMGDIMLSTAAITNIKLALPDSRLDVISRPDFNGKEMFIGSPYIDELVIFNKKKTVFFNRIFKVCFIHKKEKIRPCNSFRVHFNFFF